MSEENYSLLKPGQFIDRLALKKRQQMYALFNQHFPSAALENVIDLGVTADKAAISSNYFEKLFPDKKKIIAVSNQDASYLETIYDGLKFRFGDARKLPFADHSADVIFSSAVIEHIGSQQNQKKMLAECIRVAKKGIFITTPNRWHPVEAHTLLPLMHWLPKKMHRKILSTIGFNYYAQEENLNLLDKKTLIKFCRDLNIKNYLIKNIKTLGIPSNLVLIIKRK